MDIKQHPEFYRVNKLITQRVKDRPNGKAYHDNPEYWDKVSAQNAKEWYLRFYEEKIQESNLQLQIDPTNCEQYYRDIEMCESVIECLNGYDVELAIIKN